MREAPWVAIELERHLEIGSFERPIGFSLLPGGSPAQKSRFLHLQRNFDFLPLLSASLSIVMAEWSEDKCCIFFRRGLLVLYRFQVWGFHVQVLSAAGVS